VLVEVGEALQPFAQFAEAVVVRADRRQRFGQLGHLLGHVGRQRAEQVFLVGEVEVEGAVRCLGHLDDVVDARRVVAARLEHGHRRVEQLAHGLLALRAQLALLGRCPTSRRGPGFARACPAART
jgi:hypothetical protein